MNKQQTPIMKWHEIIFKEWDRIGQLTIQSLEKNTDFFDEGKINLLAK